MTEKDFKNRWGWAFGLTGQPAEDLDSMLATVREEARRAALETTAAMCDKDGLHNTADKIRNLATPPRTLDDVLGDINACSISNQWDGLTRQRMCNIARTAVEGLKYAGEEALTNKCRGAVDETIRKLTEIK